MVSSRRQLQQASYITSYRQLHHSFPPAAPLPPMFIALSCRFIVSIRASDSVMGMCRGPAARPLGRGAGFLRQVLLDS